MVWPRVCVIGAWLAEIVETGPDELAESPRIVIRQGEIHIRNIRPFAGLNVIA